MLSRTTTAAALLTAVLAVTSGAWAQNTGVDGTGNGMGTSGTTGTPAGTGVTSNRDDGGRDFNLGWLGLAGLIGLAGLARGDRTVHTERSSYTPVPGVGSRS